MRIRTTYRNWCEPSPERFSELADYNARAWKGVVHAPEYAERMAALQAEFDEWILATDPVRRMAAEALKDDDDG